MARDGLHYAFRINWPTTGPKSGTTDNTFYLFWTNAGTPTTIDLGSAASDVFTFFNGAGGGAGTLTYYMSPAIYRATNSVMIDVYSLDIADPHHAFGSPVTTFLKTPGAAGSTTPLPNEVALVLSYRAAYGPDPEHDGITRPRASDRGRMYLGPFADIALSHTVAPNGTGVPNVLTAIVTAALTGATTMATALNSHGFSWNVWSRKEGLFKSVGWKACDNSWDIQRKREVEPPALQNWVPL